MLDRRGGPVVELGIDDPRTRNALGVETLAALAAALDDIAVDPSVRVVVLRAGGEVFSSGADRADLADPARVQRTGALLGRVIECIARMEQPVVCRVHGDAYGAAVAVIGAADLAIASSRARFALPEPRFGFVATIAAATIVRRIGLTAALDLMLTGRRVAATEAALLGLVTAVADGSELDAVVADRVEAILQGAPGALGVTKRLVRALSGSSMDHDLATADTVGLAASPVEARAGSAAMADGRAPGWVTTWTALEGARS